MRTGKIKNVVKENPFLMRCISWFYNTLFGRNKVRIKGRGNRVVIKPNVLLTNNRIIIDGDKNSIEIDNGSRISNAYLYIWGTGHRLKMGKGIIYRKGTMLLKDKDCVIAFGDGTTIEDAYLVASESGKILIGKDCMIGHGVDIRNGDSHSVIDLATKERINPPKDIRIGDHVWLGAYSQLLKGANIGENCVVGLRSVVTGDIPENTVCIGVPAKVVKENTTWSRERV